MTEIMNINVQQAVTDPESVFETPQAMVEQVGLTRGQKISSLDRWAFSVRSRVDALSEGMLNHPAGGYTRDVELLRQIETHLDALREQNPQ